MIIGAALALLNVVHRGRPLPFGSPVRAKFTQYDDTLSASARSDADAEASSGELASGNTRGLPRLLNTYGISTACVAFRFRASGAYGGSCVKKYQYARFPRFTCRLAYRRMCHAISSRNAICAERVASSSEPAGYSFRYSSPRSLQRCRARLVHISAVVLPKKVPSSLFDPTSTSTGCCRPCVNVNDSSSGMIQPSTIMPAPESVDEISSADFARSSASGSSGGVGGPGGGPPR